MKSAHKKAIGICSVLALVAIGSALAYRYGPFLGSTATYSPPSSLSSAGASAYSAGTSVTTTSSAIASATYSYFPAAGTSTSNAYSAGTSATTTSSAIASATYSYFPAPGSSYSYAYSAVGTTTSASTVASTSASAAPIITSVAATSASASAASTLSASAAPIITSVAATSATAAPIITSVAATSASAGTTSTPSTAPSNGFSNPAPTVGFCGNGVCATNENATDCPQDCAATAGAGGDPSTVSPSTDPALSPSASDIGTAPSQSSVGQLYFALPQGQQAATQPAVPESEASFLSVPQSVINQIKQWILNFMFH